MSASLSNLPHGPTLGWKAILGMAADRPGLRGPLALLHEIEAGIPASSVERLALRISPDDKSFKFQIIPKATYERRKKEMRLSLAESERVVRLARVYEAALGVWKTDAAAQAFMARSHALLEGKTPLEVALASSVGAEVVGEILGRLEHGTAA